MDNSANFIENIIRVLEDEVPEFVWDYVVLSARDYGDFIAYALPVTPRESLTAGLRRNLANYEGRIISGLVRGTYVESDILCFCLDRGCNKVYKNPMNLNSCMTLTRSNRYIFILKAGDARKAHNHREVCRYLSPGERLTLQGFPLQSLRSFTSDAQVVSATGNAYPVPLLTAVLQPILLAVRTKVGHALACRHSVGLHAPSGSGQATILTRSSCPFVGQRISGR
ncbi:unnamed protein product [Prorocentrum cordatum]|uniref:DNA (cytosine-5-)-methyltransferase n=1 Tax=Prorocentrum cordatum TaxID=2364126 RepID=A0ABN9V1S6_9DINO|nr:unnamed protein product [Polarella glacialis]